MLGMGAAVLAADGQVGGISLSTQSSTMLRFLLRMRTLLTLSDRRRVSRNKRTGTIFCAEPPDALR
jgi:hypothetical protein